MDFRNLLKMAMDSLQGRPRAKNNIKEFKRPNMSGINAMRRGLMSGTHMIPVETMDSKLRKGLKAQRNANLIGGAVGALLDGPTKAIGTILGTSLAEALGASPYNTKGMKLQAGATLGAPGALRELNASKDIPVPYRLSESKVKDDEATALMRRRLQMLREQNMMYD